MNTKKLAAEKAVEWIKDDMIVGLGTGTTAYYAIEKIGERIKDGLRIKAVATSKNTENLARERNIPLVSFAAIQTIDVTIDGADEVDRNGNLIKGGGGALLREKIIAYHTNTYLVVVDESKLVENLGRFSLPVEIVPFAAELTTRKLEEGFGPVKIRKAAGTNFITDNGNFIADISCFHITDPEKTNATLDAIPGVVETGLFLRKMVTHVIVGRPEGDIDIKKFADI